MANPQSPASPSLFEVTLGALLSLFLGAVLAAGYLAAQPVETVRSLPKEPEEDKVYYVTGTARSSLGRQWLRKKQLLAEQGSFEIELNEDELNTWMASSESKPDGEQASGIFVAKGINFRVHEGVLQIGLPCSFSLAGINRDIVVQARGDFERSGDEFAFEPDVLLIGRFDAARLPVLGDLVYGWLMGRQAIPEDLSAAWQTLDRVAVEGAVLKLERR